MCLVAEQNENSVNLNVIVFLILESHASEINQYFDTRLLKVRQSSVYFRNYHHLAASHWSPEVKIHSIMQLAQPLYFVSRRLILSRYAWEYRNASIGIHNVLLVLICVPYFIYCMWSLFTIPWYYGNTAKSQSSSPCVSALVLSFDQTVTN